MPFSDPLPLMSSMKARQPAFPKALVGLDVARLILSIIVLGIAAWPFGVGILYAGAGLGLATAIITLIIVVWHIVAVRRRSNSYHVVAGLSLEILLVVLWLVTIGVWGYYASLIMTDQLELCDTDGDCGSVYYTSTFQDTQAAGCGLSGIIFLLSIGVLVLAAIDLSRQRRNPPVDNAVVEEMEVVTPDVVHESPVMGFK